MTNQYSGNGLYLGRFFQAAYVTRDLERTTHSFQQQYGIRAFEYMRGNRLSEHTTIDIALAWAGEVMIELIQPNGDGSSFYDAMLGPEQPGTRLHHFGHLIPDRAEWDRLKEQIERGPHAVVMQGSVENFVNYIYVDARATVGHFLEYILPEAGGRAFFDSLPRS